VSWENVCFAVRGSTKAKMVNHKTWVNASCSHSRNQNNKIRLDHDYSIGTSKKINFRKIWEIYQWVDYRANCLIKQVQLMKVSWGGFCAK
jgi:hypothetical protein